MKFIGTPLILILSPSSYIAFLCACPDYCGRSFSCLPLGSKWQLRGQDKFVATGFVLCEWLLGSRRPYSCSALQDSNMYWGVIDLPLNFSWVRLLEDRSSCLLWYTVVFEVSHPTSTSQLWAHSSFLNSNSSQQCRSSMTSLDS